MTIFGEGSTTYSGEGSVSTNSSSLLNFSQFNFVQTCETDYFYDSSTTTQLDNKIEQCYNPISSLTGYGIFIIEILFVVCGIWFLIFKRFGKKKKK